jgi:hypothetical protein
MGRPIGVWIATAYLLVLLAVAVFWNLDAPMGSGRVFVVLMSVTLLLLSMTLLPSLSRWAMPATVGVAATQGGSYLLAILSPVTEPIASPNTVVLSIQFNLVPPIFLTATIAVALYTAWLWRTGVLR